jgi:phosphohistidine phosphatase SixA
MMNALVAQRPAHEIVIQRQQARPACQDLLRLQPGHDLAQSLGQKLGASQILLGCLPQNQTACLMKWGALWALAWVCLLGWPAQASELAQRLRSSDHVLLMRHAYAPGVGDPPGFNLARCDTQRVLNQDGKRQAQRTGQWLRQQGVHQALIYSSIWCRCQQTAEGLQLGPVRIESSLGSFFQDAGQAEPQTRALQAFIAQTLPTKGDQALILVTHQVNITELTGRYVGTGDMVLARVNPQGKVLDIKIYPGLGS